MFLKLACAALTLAFLGKASADTILDDQFCQVYYTLGDENCPALRDTIRSETRGEGTPTLELGNPETQPAMVFFHGWPDTSATWANQFATFCGEDKEYFCVSPSMIDFHPDVPLADSSDLLWSRQWEKYHAVIEELGLSNITLVAFDFGAVMAYPFTYKYSNLISKLVTMDIPLTPGDNAKPADTYFMDLPYYKQVNIYSYLAGDDKVIDRNVRMMGNCPCMDCRIAPGAEVGVGARSGWPYYGFVKFDDPWTEALSDILYEQWEFDFMPSFPKDIPILYLWSPLFPSPRFLEWIENRGDGLSDQMFVESDHWLSLRQPKLVNDKLAEWFAATNGPEQQKNEALNDSKEPAMIRTNKKL